MAEMVERVARAISGCCKNQSDWDLRVRMARAAIAAMYEPTHRMVRVAEIEHRGVISSRYDDYYTSPEPGDAMAMIYKTMVEEAMRNG